MLEKKFIPIALVTALFTEALSAQPCPSSVSQISLEGNSIRARIRNNGTLFYDGSDGQFIPNPMPNGPNPSTIFAAALWIGGVDPAGNLKLMTPTYGAGYASGPLNDDGATDAGTCADWDRHFLVTGDNIAAFLADLPSLAGNPGAALAQYPAIMGWPGKGNSYFEDVWGFGLPLTQYDLAPFFDSDTDGQYDPLNGDYPAVVLHFKEPFVPAEIVWSVYNDSNNSDPFGMQIQQTAWAFNCPDQPVLNRTVFTSHKMIYKGQEWTDSCYVGMWVDFDLGCFTDDFLGSAPDLNAFYAYNQDAVDGTTGAACEQGITTFADNPPVQSVTFLSEPLDKYVYFNNPGYGIQLPGTTDPTIPWEFYRYLTGSWRDGSPLTYSGSGYQSSNDFTDFAFPSDPSDPGGWSMCSVDNMPVADRKGIGIRKVGLWPPGHVRELTVAWTVHPDPDLPCGLGATFDEVAALRDLYDSDFGGVCSPVSAAPEIPETTLAVYPNPAANTVTVHCGNPEVRGIQVLAADGRVVKNLQNIQNEQIVLDVADLKSGMYTLLVMTEKSIMTQKVAVLR